MRYAGKMMQIKSEGENKDYEFIHMVIKDKLTLYELDEEKNVEALMELLKEYKVSTINDIISKQYVRTMFSVWATDILKGEDKEDERSRFIKSFTRFLKLREEFIKLYDKTDKSLSPLRRSLHAFYHLIRNNDMKYKERSDNNIQSLLEFRFDCETISDLYMQFADIEGIKTVGSVFEYKNKKMGINDYVSTIINDYDNIKFAYTFYLLYYSTKRSADYENELIDFCLFDSKNVPDEIRFKMFQVPPDKNSKIPSDKITFALRQKYYVIVELINYFDDFPTDRDKIEDKIEKGRVRYRKKWVNNKNDFSFYYAYAKFYLEAIRRIKDEEYKNTLTKHLFHIIITGIKLYGEKMIKQNFDDYPELIDIAIKTYMKDTIPNK